MSSEPQQKKAKHDDVAASDDADPPKDQRGDAALIEQGHAWMLYRLVEEGALATPSPRVSNRSNANRPKVASAGAADAGASSASDIQRLFIILQPDTPGSGSRLIVVPKKHLPDAHTHERFFAFVGAYPELALHALWAALALHALWQRAGMSVNAPCPPRHAALTEAVANTPAELTAALTESHYSTQTRGERVQPAARAAAQGTYVLAKGGHGSSSGVRLGCVGHSEGRGGSECSPAWAGLAGLRSPLRPTHAQQVQADQPSEAGRGASHAGHQAGGQLCAQRQGNARASLASTHTACLHCP